MYKSHSSSKINKHKAVIQIYSTCLSTSFMHKEQNKRLALKSNLWQQHDKLNLQNDPCWTDLHLIFVAKCTVLHLTLCGTCMLLHVCNMWLNIYSRSCLICMYIYSMCTCIGTFLHCVHVCYFMCPLKLTSLHCMCLCVSMLLRLGGKLASLKLAFCPSPVKPKLHSGRRHWESKPTDWNNHVTNPP